MVQENDFQPWEEVAVLAVDYSNRDYVGQDLAAS